MMIFKLNIEDDLAIYVGKINDNITHKHYAIQINIATTKSILIGNKTEYYSSCLIKSSVPHKLYSDNDHLLILVNPLSPFGHYLSQENFIDIDKFNNPLQKTLMNILSKYVQKEMDFKTLCRRVKQQIQLFNCECSNSNHFFDDRVHKALLYIEKKSNEVISLDEIAKHCNLSPSRFLHLFKEKTGITFRQSQLWIKLVKSLKSLPYQDIKQTSYQYGFSDGAHYSKVFKQTFGFSPNHFIKK